MKILKVLMILFLLTNFGLLSSIAHAEDSGLNIFQISGESTPKIFEHCVIWVDIANSDDFGHHFLVELGFSEQHVSEYGYINPNEHAIVTFSVVPNHLGQLLVIVDLYQDGRTLEAWVERKNTTVKVIKTHTKYEETLSRFNTIEYNLESIENEIEENRNTLNIASIVIIVQFFVIFGIAWYFHRKFRAINEQISRTTK